MKKVMTVERAMSRLEWHFTKDKRFSANKDDLEAYNALAEFVNRKHKDQLSDHQLFGKLYAYLFGQFVIYYKGTCMSKVPHTELNRLCLKDWGLLLQEVTDVLNSAESNRWLDEKYADFPIENTVEEVEENISKMINSVMDEYYKSKEK